MTTNKVAALAQKFQTKLAQEAAGLGGNTPAPAADEQTKLQEAAEGSKQQLLVFMGLHNASPTDVKFDDLKIVTDPATGKKAVSWKLSVAPALAQSFNAATEKAKNSYPGFSPARYLSQLLTKNFPGMSNNGIIA